MDRSWTLAELTAKAASVLSDGRSAPPSGRGRDLPGERTIRWYVTIGLVDPPLSRRGRIAVYGPRHLLQLVAIKRRQAEGRSLADIQAELTGATDATLRRIARLDPVDVTAAETATAPTSAPTGDSLAPGERPPAPGAPAPGEAAPELAARRFWAERPASPPGRGTAPPESEPAPRAPHTDAAPGVRGAADGAQDVAESIRARAGHAGHAGHAVTAARGPADAARASGTDDAVDATGADDTGRAVTAARGAAGAPGADALVRGVRLAPGVTLLLDTSPSPDDAMAIVAAAAPLLDLLSERELLL
jgi:hypothetical protein